MRYLIALLVLVTCAAACGKNTEPPPPSSGSPNAPTESGPKNAMRPANHPDEQALKMYATVCVMCHGPEGKGDGNAAATLNPKPRNYTDAAWQATVTDDEIKKIILLGGAGVGKSASMPGQPQLKEQPLVLDGLVKIVRGFAKPQQPPQ